LLYIISRNIPFDAENINYLLDKINEGNYSVPMTLSKEAVSFINCMLQYYPQNRLDTEKLSKHKFLTKNVKDFTIFDLDDSCRNNSKINININIKNDNEILITLNEVNPGESNYVNNLDNMFYKAFEDFQKYSIPVEPKLVPFIPGFNCDFNF